ncbi:hypothetical protein G7K_3895-t1 [Saitoella complicata NRRL Y-17804]|uniref:RNA-directed DNA polymerase n=1 Tax=Saitoella complicata (strain BCRC 22490 / CBS 7301 / JCM 7358 / NBRC 10748 / NRRL Y-17804) TaxID=698492 RepID=A0A0E9NIW3_SAICN|nr:hypothetical protein G7K_3895-t1 [Saitoella complicata NRRL Y-17804]
MRHTLATNRLLTQKEREKEPGTVLIVSYVLSWSSSLPLTLKAGTLVLQRIDLLLLSSVLHSGPATQRPKLEGNRADNNWRRRTDYGIDGDAETGHRSIPRKGSPFPPEHTSTRPPSGSSALGLQTPNTTAAQFDSSGIFETPEQDLSSYPWSPADIELADAPPLSTEEVDFDVFGAPGSRTPTQETFRPAATPTTSSNEQDPFVAPAFNVRMTEGRNVKWPRLGNFKTIRKWDGNAADMDDFFTSVSAYIIGNNLPLAQGGYVMGDDDDGYEYIRTLEAEHPTVDKADRRANYKLGERFCVQVAEKLEGSARDWWLGYAERQSRGEVNRPNCWIPAPVGYQPSNVIEISLRRMLQMQFTDTRDVEAAHNMLNSLEWDFNKETVPNFRTRVQRLIIRARLNDRDQFVTRRHFILESIPREEMRLRIGMPSSDDALWAAIEDAVATQISIKASKKLTKVSEKKKCTNCGRIGHVVSECRQKRNVPTPPSSTGPVVTSRRTTSMTTASGVNSSVVIPGQEATRCYNCNKLGHMGKDCPEKRHKGRPLNAFDTTEEENRLQEEDVHVPGCRCTECLGATLNSMLPSPPRKKARPFFSFNAVANNNDGITALKREAVRDKSSAAQMCAVQTFPFQKNVPFNHALAVTSKHEVVNEGDTLWDPTTRRSQNAQLHYYLEDKYVGTKFGDEGKAKEDDIVIRLPNRPKIKTAPETNVWLMSQTVDGQDMLTVFDTGTSCNVILRSTLVACGYKISSASDVHFTMVEDKNTYPIGIVDRFFCRLNGQDYIIKVYVIESASFQLLVGTKFMWLIGASLFPQYGCIAIEKPVKMVLDASTKDPDLGLVRQLEKVEWTNEDGEVVESIDPPTASGPSTMSKTRREQQLNLLQCTDTKAVPFLYAKPSSQAILIGQREYLAEDEEEASAKKVVTALMKSGKPLLSEEFILSQVSIGEEAPTWFCSEVAKLIAQYADAISWNDHNLGCIQDVPHEIKVTSDKPCVMAMRKHLYTPKNAAIIREKTDPLIDMGIYRTSTSPHRAQLVIASKNRVCHDLRMINEIMVVDPYPTVPVQYIMATQADKGMFISADADRGFQQIIMALLAITFTAFERLGEHLESLRMLFGFVNAPATWNRNADVMLGSAKKGKRILNYMDDLIAGSKAGDYKHQLELLKELLRRGLNHGWKFKLTKLKVAHTKIKFVGYIMSAAGLEADPSKIDALMSLRLPDTGSEIRSYFGLANWFRDQMPAFADNTRSLAALMKTTGKVTLTPEAIAEIDWIKVTLRTKRVLAHWVEDRLTKVYTDTSAKYIGCVITQWNPEENCELVVAFASAVLNGAQMRYHITRQEALAFIWTLGKFHGWLSTRPFVWCTDHKALNYIFKAASSSLPALMRYALVASEYRFTTEWIAGKTMIADTISRLRIESVKGEGLTTADIVHGLVMNERPTPSAELLMLQQSPVAQAKVQTFYAVLTRKKAQMAETQTPITESVITKEDDSIKFSKGLPDEELEKPETDGTEDLRGRDYVDLPALTRKEYEDLRALSHIHGYITDGTLPNEKSLQKRVKQLSKNVFLQDNQLYKTVKNLLRVEVIIGEKNRRAIFKHLHEGYGHRGAPAMLEWWGTRYWSPVIEKLVLRHIGRCEACQKHSRNSPLKVPGYQTDVKDLFRHWSTDFAGPFPESPEGYKYVLIAVESLTRWAEVRAVKTADAATTAEFFYEEIIARYGVPLSIQSDNGSHFVNDVVKQLAKTMSIRHHLSTPYYPQSNGRAERFLGTLKPSLKKSILDCDKNDDGTVKWKPAMYVVLWAYRSMPHHATKASPAYLVYGVELRIPVDAPTLANQKVVSPAMIMGQAQHRTEVAERIEWLREGIPGLRTAAMRYVKDKKGNAVLVHPKSFNLGDKVWLRDSALDSQAQAPVFSPRWKGPYIVHDVWQKGVYKLRQIPKNEAE